MSYPNVTYLVLGVSKLPEFLKAVLGKTVWQAEKY